MTSPTQSPVESAELADPANPDSLDSEAKPVIPAFKFPFKPGELAGAKDGNQPWYKNGAKNGHTKTPGMAPPGTRRSMGKR
ncbi:hypothetical protein H097_12083 [Pseudomonas sp. FH4]|jgi:hypothetical protein|uniref:Uncharacterized protein n=1 Tax=Pseudomonas brenneri TaxID=129817 RepID=A0A5B2USH3_9PSED|nr:MULTISPECIES: hypothetical protein [Pseudomonas]KAA6168388.1 hypothetical protein F3K50_23230 [Pseudomonas marginalis]ETK18549.1 hypothetical protein H097_12083 [Pseudomonas sp. FH4]KAA2229691.1 hypothetical protein F1720_14820 [Pseudomonas brenneri]MBF8006386.1 hypothetical protein [Pseudomonas brenneri]TWR81114.1 hypothetical protein FJD34_04435 [Pseudomonas brenneri]